MDTNTKWILVILVIVGLVVLFYNKNEHADVRIGDICSHDNYCVGKCDNEWNIDGTVKKYGLCKPIKLGDKCYGNKSVCETGSICTPYGTKSGIIDYYMCTSTNQQTFKPKLH